MSLLSIVASSSAFFLPASPPPNGSSIDSDWSTKNKKHPGLLRLISAWYAMVFLHFLWHHENYNSHICSNARVRCVTLVTGERARAMTFGAPSLDAAGTSAERLSAHAAPQHAGNHLPPRTCVRGIRVISYLPQAESRYRSGNGGPR